MGVSEVSRTASLAVFALVGCGPIFGSGAADDDDSTASIDEDDDAKDDEDVGSDDEDDGQGFLPDPEEDRFHECDLYEQNCPRGEKCMPIATDGGNSWDSSACRPIAPNPDAPGEPCIAMHSGVSGLDSCELGSMCWDLDHETLEGTCVSFCIGSEHQHQCADPDLTCNYGRTFSLCQRSCCPLEENCSEDQACIPHSEEFLCVPVDDDAAAFGEGCEFINACQSGLTCAAASAVPDCTGSAGCCTTFCDLEAPDCAELHQDLECVPYYEDGYAPPGFRHIGLCMLPQ